MEQITSAANSKIKLAASLHMKKNRDKLGLFVAEGVRLVEMAADSDWQLEFALVTSEKAEDTRVAAIIDKFVEKGCPVYETSEAVYKKVADTVTPQGLLAVMKKRSFRLNDLAGENAFLAVLDGVQDAGNAGSIIRTADAVGCNGVIFLNGCVDAFSDKTVRSAMGSVFHLPIVENISVSDFLDYCRENSVAVYSTALDKNAESCFSITYGNKKALVFGNEGNGVSQQILNSTEHVYIPMAGGTESLNVAAAAAVVLYGAVYSQKT